MTATAAANDANLALAGRVFADHDAVIEVYTHEVAVGLLHAGHVSIVAFVLRSARGGFLKEAAAGVRGEVIASVSGLGQTDEVDVPAPGPDAEVAVPEQRIGVRVGDVGGPV